MFSSYTLAKTIFQKSKNRIWSHAKFTKDVCGFPFSGLYFPSNKLMNDRWKSAANQRSKKTTTWERRSRHGMSELSNCHICRSMLARFFSIALRFTRGRLYQSFSLSVYLSIWMIVVHCTRPVVKWRQISHVRFVRGRARKAVQRCKNRSESDEMSVRYR